MNRNAAKIIDLLNRQAVHAKRIARLCGLITKENKQRVYGLIVQNSMEVERLQRQIKAVLISMKFKPGGIIGDNRIGPGEYVFRHPLPELTTTGAPNIITYKVYNDKGKLDWSALSESLSRSLQEIKEEE